MDSSVISSPPVISTFSPPQDGQTASTSLVSAVRPQSGQEIVAGTVTSVTAEPSASVPSATKTHAWASDSSTTACFTPNRTRIPATLRPPARWRTVASTPSAKPYSCIPLLALRRRVARLAPLDQLVHHRADQRAPAATRSGPFHGRPGHGLDGGNALGQH